MAETWCVQGAGGRVLFTFYAGPAGTQMVEITIGENQARFTVGEFCRDMYAVSEVAARRSALHGQKAERG